MKDEPTDPKPSDRRRKVKKTLLEAVIVAVVGSVLALAANTISPRGLTLAKNYFPGATNGAVSAPVLPLLAGIKQKGLQWLDGRQAAQLFKDPRFQQQMIVFLDARDPEHFQQGHIPGAYEFDPYHAENYFADVLPVCQTAEQVVVYCNGGDCEDSQFAAVALRDAGIANQKLFVFAGGMPEWTLLGMPVETGGRNGGKRRDATE